MNIEIFVFIIILAFLCELIDTSLGGGYGTILTPLLLIFGFTTLLIIPSILVSEICTGLTAAIAHHKYKNCELKRNNENTKVFLLISVVAVIGTILAVFLVLNIQQIYVKLYIGILVTIVGMLAMTNFKFKYSRKKIMVLGGVAGFNKSLSGGGFGPLLTAGQVVSGRNAKESVGIALGAEFPVCLAGLITYIILTGLFDSTLAIALTFGALLSVPFGAFLTKKIKNEKLARRFVGVLAMFLGIYTIINIFM